MTLALHRGGPDDYDVIHDGETVGRIYRMKAGRRSFTLWSLTTPKLRYWVIGLWATCLRDCPKRGASI